MELTITISGSTPLLMNAFTDAAQIAATSGSRSSLTGDRGSPEEQAASKLYRSTEGVIVIPQPNLLRCLIDAGKFFKAGKSKVTTLKSTIITSCLDLPAVEYELAYQGNWHVDTRPVRIPATGGRILAHRPCFHGWSLTFEAELDTSVMGVGLFREIVDKAGSAIGLGDFRPDCKGPFGKFKVSQWAVQAEPLREVA
jgi:hypothetical protein